jgi:hypothetical protein
MCWPVEYCRRELPPLTVNVPAFGDDSSAGFNFDNTIVNLVDTRAAGEVIAPVAVASPSAGSRFLLTIYIYIDSEETSHHAGCRRRVRALCPSSTTSARLFKRS